MRRAAWVAGGLVVVAAAVTGVVLLARAKSDEPAFRTEAVTRGDVVQAVTASGTLSAVTTVKVGSQVSGIIAALHADYNSAVTTGQLLAELDPQPFQAAVDQRQADLERSRADLHDARRELARSRRLTEQGIISRAELDASIARHDGAAATVRQSEASLRQAQVNLENARITSPIDGVVVNREYDVGQTVAASFSAPTLFTIAKDLTKMQVLTNIDEADIGGVTPGQPATFTVDAFPEDAFQGRVSQVRLASQTVQNVVTYPVVIDVDNPDGRLKPGMTANVSVPVARREGVLRLPNAALRFRPDPAVIARAAEPAPTAGVPPRAAAEGAPARPTGEPPAGRRGGRRAGGGEGGGGAGVGATVYVPAPGGKVRAVRVVTSITDGQHAAIESGDLAEGDLVVVGLATTRASSAGTSGLGGQAGGGGRGRRM